MQSGAILFRGFLRNTRGTLTLEDGRLRFESDGEVLFAVMPGEVRLLKWPNLLRGRVGIGQLQVVTLDGVTHRLSFTPGTMFGSFLSSLRLADAWGTKLNEAGFPR